MAKAMVRSRDSVRTRSTILKAATAAFAAKGLSGARIDEIAEEANINKRMLYHYFGNKEGLYRAVIENIYGEITAAANDVHMNDVPPMEGLERLVSFVWNYYKKHTEAIYLLHEENVHRAKHVKDSKYFATLVPNFVNNISELVSDGKKAGVFRDDVDVARLYVTIVALVFFYRSHQYTLSLFLNTNLKTKKAHEDWYEHIKDVIFSYVRK